MASQLILKSDKPNVNLWLDAPLESPSEIVSKGYNGEEYTYHEIVHAVFIDHFEQFATIKIRIIGIDNIDKDEINIAPVVSFSFPHLKHNLSNVDKNLYDFCHNNGITLLQAMPRETIDHPNSQEIVDIVTRCIINRGFSSDTIKIFYLAYDIIPSLTPIKNYLICEDYFNVFLADFTTRHSLTSTVTKSNKRTYNFSLLAGQVNERYYRILFLANAYEQNILQSDFFHTTYIKDKDQLNQFIEESFTNTPHHALVKKHAKESFKHYTVDNKGRVLQDKNIYDDKIEYGVPIQVLDSYVHVVLETQVDIPSLSEKIYKPLMAGLIFLWHGPVNTLQYLESLGFKRYKHVDYSFDSHPDPMVRLDLLLTEIRRLKKRDLSVLIKINRRIIEHNQNKFWEISSNMDRVWRHFK